MTLKFQVVCGIHTIFEICAIFLFVNFLPMCPPKFSGVCIGEKIVKSFKIWAVSVSVIQVFCCMHVHHCARALQRVAGVETGVQ